MDLDIQFGDLEHARPQVQLRPDENKHYAVVGVFAPDDRDLPVFVDLDALADMEDHALSDTRVELGGVMLGGQYEDEQGRPFVVVSDSLRAKHYESTKGSFKFTHDTWSEITRERDEFPEELQMVGWYHTHPDWGVFLSGMDMFICDNFFNKPLDVALVIDPCRQDRGFFQWTGDENQRVRRTGGFYLIGSRFRHDELEYFAAILEGKLAMANDPRLRGSQYPAPVVNIAGTQPAWQAVAVLGMLAMQFCLLLVVAVRLLWPLPDDAAAPPAELAALQESVDRLAASRQAAADVDAKLEVVQSAIRNWEGTPDGLLEALAEQTAQNKRLTGSFDAQHEVLATREQQVDALQKSLSLEKHSGKRLADKVEALQASISALKTENDELQDKLATAEKKTPDGDALDEPHTFQWTWIGIGAAVVALFLVGAVASMLKNKKEEEEDPDFEDSAEEPPGETNN